jgi:histidinol-phosphate/aromatic aminotransferase/cobyric acid decarboxylase-like protein
MTQLSMIGPLPPDAVKINANENPLGPCKEAAEAICAVVQKGGRYMYEQTFTMASVLAEQEGVEPDYALPCCRSPRHRRIS